MKYYSQLEANNTYTHFAVTESGTVMIRHDMSLADNVKADNVPYKVTFANKEVLLKRAVEII